MHHRPKDFFAVTDITVFVPRADRAILAGPSHGAKSVIGAPWIKFSGFLGRRGGRIEGRTWMKISRMLI